jgi:sugar phosphate isomerase/epimerase
MLKAEILYCKKIGAKELVFHIDKKNITSDDIKKIRELARLANDNGVQMLLENLSNSKLNQFQLLFEKIPDLKMNLDIGHLNRMLYKKSIKSFDEFITPLRDKIVYIHVHNNYGEHDDHFSLDRGNLDYRKALSLVDLKRVKKLILEMRDIKDINISRGLLEKALDQTQQ